MAPEPPRPALPRRPEFPARGPVPASPAPPRPGQRVHGPEKDAASPPAPLSLPDSVSAARKRLCSRRGPPPPPESPGAGPGALPERGALGGPVGLGEPLVRNRDCGGAAGSGTGRTGCGPEAERLAAPAPPAGWRVRGHWVVSCVLAWLVLVRADPTASPRPPGLGVSPGARPLGPARAAREAEPGWSGGRGRPLTAA
ncbi:translation initiation factor IF-2-like [Talpa occidentalis]|uniref:translation initiation factor IF-2-like n=1 Tax=Talpa occidentalis TaxID=50954 RepID=UPI0023F64C13|nr:translation initiation factor IF-2-like [Talpa occidentalis]